MLRRNMDVVFLIWFYIIGILKAVELPVQKCRLENSSCLIQSMQKALPIFAAGLPNLNISVLDPMELEEVSYLVGNVRFSLSKTRLSGLKNAVFDKVEWDSANKKIRIEIHMNSTLRGNYKAEGKVSVLPIDGDGQLKVKIKNLALKMLMDYNISKDTSKKDHVVPEKIKFTHEADIAAFNVTNLFKDNKELSETAIKFLNENSKQIVTEFGRPIIEKSVDKVFKNIVAYFAFEPIEEIAIL